MSGIINPTYNQLIAAFPPRPITSDTQFWATQDRVDTLLDKEILSSDEEDYLMTLGMMIEQYEEIHEPNTDLYGIALIRALIAEKGLTQRDLVKPIFKTDSIASTILNGKRRLTTEHIDRLATYFNLPHACFFEPVVSATEATGKTPKPIAPPPSKYHPNPFKKFISNMDLEELRTSSGKPDKLKQFKNNNLRLGV